MLRRLLSLRDSGASDEDLWRLLVPEFPRPMRRNRVWEAFDRERRRTSGRPYGLVAQRPQNWTAAAGSPETGGVRFKSPWERRLAAALDRVGVKWAYEPDYFTYSDGASTWRRYWPDFRLDDFTNVYVEVKGPSGADAGDSWKMQRVLANYPQITLLLWDATTIEYIEDVADSSYVIGLLRTTKLAA